jgi:hypothetical protein
MSCHVAVRIEVVLVWTITNMVIGQALQPVFTFIIMTGPRQVLRCWATASDVLEMVEFRVLLHLLTQTLLAKANPNSYQQ